MYNLNEQSKISVTKILKYSIKDAEKLSEYEKTGLASRGRSLIPLCSYPASV